MRRLNERQRLKAKNLLQILWGYYYDLEGAKSQEEVDNCKDGIGKVLMRLRQVLDEQEDNTD